jgi:hypothetical protein
MREPDRPKSGADFPLRDLHTQVVLTVIAAAAYRLLENLL